MRLNAIANGKIQMRNMMKKELVLLLMSAMLIMAGGASAVGVPVFTSGSDKTCAGNITIEADGSVKCATGELQPRCIGNIIIDSKGVVRCKTAAKRTCTLTVGTKVAGKTELKTECTPVATTYEWSDSSCSMNSATCGVTPTVDTTYTVTGKDAAGNIGSSSVTVSGTSAQPGSQPSCSLTASPPSISAGSSSTLTASCSPAASYTWSWFGGTCTGNTTNTCTVSPTVTTDYTVTAQSSAGSGTAYATVSVAAAPVTGPPQCQFKQPPTVINGKTVLDAQCNPAATLFAWSDSNCPKDYNRCDVTPTATTDYTVTGSNGYGTGNTATIKIIVAAPTPTTPNCILNALPSSIAPGDKSILTASCSPAATSYTWTGGTCANKVTTSVISDTVIGTTVEVASAAGMEIGDALTIAGNPGTFSIIAITGNVLTFTPATTAVTTINATVTANKAATCTVTPAASAEYTVVGKNDVGEGNSAKATVSVTVPTCKLTATPKEIDKGGSSELKAECTPVATGGYTWTGETCAGNTTNTCTVRPEATTEYTVIGKNSVGYSNQAKDMVFVMAPKCTLIANPLSIAPGGSSTLTASCSPAATGGYTWTGGTCVGNTTNTCTVTPTATTEYTVTGKNSLGLGDPGSATVSLAADPGCPNGYSYSEQTIYWAAGVSIKGPKHTMNHCEVKAFQISMPAHDVSVSETVYAQVPMYMSLSTRAFDFSPSLESSGCAKSGLNDPRIRHSTTGWPGACLIVPGVTYYLNVRNASSREGPDNCPAGSECTFYLSW